jgi:integrase
MRSDGAAEGAELIDASVASAFPPFRAQGPRSAPSAAGGRRCSRRRRSASVICVSSCVAPSVTFSSEGTIVGPVTFYVKEYELLTKAKLPATIRFHDLRHFAATTLLTNGPMCRQRRPCWGIRMRALLLIFMPTRYRTERGLWSTIWSTRRLGKKSRRNKALGSHMAQ